jgi:hypothetical protein
VPADAWVDLEAAAEPILWVPKTVSQRFLNTGGIIENHRGQITIRLNRRTYSPFLRQASLPKAITVPWWGG